MFGRRLKATLSGLLLAITVTASATTVSARTCGNTGDTFSKWMPEIMAEAQAKGISRRAINAGLKGVSYDRRIVTLDRNQKSFTLSDEAFYRRRVGPQILRLGRSKLAKHRQLLDRIEKRFAVDREILITIWGLETYYGADGAGGKSIFRSLATLAYDCRRSEFFTRELLAALQVLDTGELSVQQMRGGWAGEIGPMQFLPSIYIGYGVDFDGKGRDLVNSVPDFLATTANFLKAKGWQLGASMEPGSNNFNVLREWNRAEVYRKTMVRMAAELR